MNSFPGEEKIHWICFHFFPHLQPLLHTSSPYRKQMLAVVREPNKEKWVSPQVGNSRGFLLNDVNLWRGNFCTFSHLCQRDIMKLIWVFYICIVVEIRTDLVVKL